MVLSRTVLALACVALLFFAFPVAYVLVILPAAPLIASLWRPRIASYGVVVLLVLYVLASLAS